MGPKAAVGEAVGLGSLSDDNERLHTVHQQKHFSREYEDQKQIITAAITPTTVH